MHALDPDIAVSEVDEGFHRAFSLLSAPQDGTRRAAQLVLKNLINTYVANCQVEQAKQLRGVFKTVERGLDLAHQDTVLEVLPGLLRLAFISRQDSRMQPY